MITVPYNIAFTILPIILLPGHTCPMQTYHLHICPLLTYSIAPRYPMHNHVHCRHVPYTNILPSYTCRLHTYSLHIYPLHICLLQTHIPFTLNSPAYTCYMIPYVPCPHMYPAYICPLYIHVSCTLVPIHTPVPSTHMPSVHITYMLSPTHVCYHSLLHIFSTNVTTILH